MLGRARRDRLPPQREARRRGVVFSSPDRETDRAACGEATIEADLGSTSAYSYSPSVGDLSFCASSCFSSASAAFSLASDSAILASRNWT